MELRYTITLKDAYHADMVSMRHSTRFRLIALLLLALAAFGVLSATLHGINVITVFSIIAGPLALAAGIALRRRMLRRMLSMYPGYGEERTVTLDGSGIHTVMQSASSSLKWNMIDKVIESDKTFLIRYSPAHYSFIPKWAFHGKDELVQASSLFRKHAARYVSAGKFAR